MEARDWQGLTPVIQRYEQVQTLAARLAGKGWTTEVIHEEDFYVVCRPPTGHPAETDEDLRKLLEAQGVDVTGFGFFDEDEDFDPNKLIDGEVSINDHDHGYGVLIDDDEDFDLSVDLMTKGVAEALAGKKIEVVDLVEDYRVVMHLEGGKKLIYDEDNFCLTLE